MAYKDFKDLPWKRVSDKVLHDKFEKRKVYSPFDMKYEKICALINKLI